VKRGRYVLIPASEDTRGHGTTGLARFWKHHLAELLSAGPPAAK
jgi:homoserine O-acetyltransferase